MQSTALLVLFGHQSVGQNILDGIAELAHTGVAVPRVLVDLNQPTDAAPGVTLAHFRVGKNGAPLTKIHDFERTVMGDAGRRAQAALFKFCYVDLRDANQVAPLFEAYLQMTERLQRERPDLVLAHVTMPLRSVPTGIVATARRLLGQRHPQSAANAARHAFNELLRERCGSVAPLFDLAAIESGGRDAAPRLLPLYTDDGGHLNRQGRQVVAERFVDFLERLAGGGTPQ